MGFKELVWLWLAVNLVAGCARMQPSTGRPLANGPPGPTSPLVDGPPPTPPPPAVSAMDKETEALVRRSLKKDVGLSPADKKIDVDVKRGVVTLNGTVPTTEDRDAVAKQIAKIPGVDRIDNHLRVAQR